MAVMIEEVQLEVTDSPEPPPAPSAKAQGHSRPDFLSALQHARERELRLRAD